MAGFRGGREMSQQSAEPNFDNRTLYHGDNLEFLRGMNSETDQVKDD